MLYLLLQLAGDCYAIEAAQIVEVLPMVKARRLPRSPVGLAGVFDYHGQPVPLVDLTELAFGIPSRRWMSTRIVIVNSCSRPGAPTKALGLLAEEATETLRRSDADFVDTGVVVAAAPYLGKITTHSGQSVQRIDIQNLLSGSVRDLLFRERMDAE